VFLRNINNIFLYTNKSIEVLETVNNRWFSEKDILTILGYEITSSRKVL